MDFDTLISSSWKDHHAQLDAVQVNLREHAALADSGERAGKLAVIVNHVFGQHAHAWDQAASLIAAVVGALPEPVDLTRARRELAIARYLSGDPTGAMRVELESMAEDPDQALATVVSSRAVAAEALLGAGRGDEAIPLYHAAESVAHAVDGLHETVARTLAICANNMAGTLLDRDDRDAVADQALAVLAASARTHWLVAGNWVNDERADYLLALVHNALDNPETALEHARRGLQTIQDNDPDKEKVDQAFLHLAEARAHHLLGAAAAREASLAVADRLGKAFEADWLVSWFQDERGKSIGLNFG